MYGRTRTSLIAAWLALIAVAMLFVAPAVSKSLAAQTACQNTQSAMPAHCANASPMDYRTKAMSPGEKIACGYCQLLLHLPFIPLVLAALFWLLLIFVTRSPLVQLLCAPRFQPWTPQRARAPPAVFLSPLNH